MLNLDLTQYNPVQSDSQYANVPLPSAHLVVIDESEMKDSVKDGFTKGQNLLLEMTILASSTGNDFVGEKLPLYIPINGFDETALKAGMKRLSTLAYTLGVGGFLQNKEDLHGTNFIVVLEKDGKTNFPKFKRILNVNGQEIADASGNFRECELKDVALATELEKLLAMLQQGGGNQASGGFGNAQAQPNNFGTVPTNTPPQNQQANFGNQQQNTANFTQQNNTQAQPNFGNQQQSFVPNTNFGGNQASGGFGNAQAQPNNFGTVPNQPAWGQAVNPQNGQ